MGVETVVPAVLFLSLAYVVVGVTKLVAENRTRRQLVEKGATPELARAVMASPQADLGLYGALKWGLVIGAVGLALVVVQFMPYRPDQPIVYGTVLLFGAAGLLAYYAIGRRGVGRTATPA